MTSDAPTFNHEEPNNSLSSDIDGLPGLERPQRLEELPLYEEVTRLLGVLDTAQKHLRCSQQFLRRLTGTSETVRNGIDTGTGDLDDQTISLQDEVVVSFQLQYPPTDASSDVYVADSYTPDIPKSVTPRGDIRVAIREHFNALLWKDAVSRNYRVLWKNLNRNLLKTKRRFINWPGEIEFKQVLDVATLKKSDGAELLLDVGIEDWTSKEIRQTRKDNVPLIISTYGQVLLRAGEI